jgi:N-acetylglucosamine-6-phosphate deacetylase
VTYCDISLNDAVKMGTLYPAQLIGIENLTATIENGHQANLLVLDDDLNLKEVIFKGETI